MTAAIFAQTRRNGTGNTRLEYRYDTPAPGCYNAANPAASTCGNTSLYYPSDPFNQAMRPVPSRVNINTGKAAIENRVAYQRLLRAGSVDAEAAHVERRDPLRPCDEPLPGNVHWRQRERAVCAHSGWRDVCREEQLLHARHTDGVSYNDFTPRWGVAWDIFGTGKTSIKWNMGKYLAGAAVSGIYADANPAQRAVNEYVRSWTDVDGDRRVDCDLLNFNAQDLSASGGDICGGPGSVFDLPLPGRYAVRARPAQPGCGRHADWSADDAVRTHRRMASRRLCRPTATPTATACSMGGAGVAPSGRSASASSTSSCRAFPPR